MELQLHSGPETRFEDPLGELREVDLSPDRREEDRRVAKVEMVTFDHLDCIVEVTAVENDKLDLVAIGEAVEVLPAVSPLLAAPRAFDVEDTNCPRIEHADIEAPAGLDQHLITLFTQLPDEFPALVLLDERLAPGNLDQRTVEFSDLLEHHPDAHFSSAREGVFTVTPGTAQVAPGESHEDTGSSGVG